MFQEKYREMYKELEEFKSKTWIHFDKWIYNNREIIIYIVATILKIKDKKPEGNNSVLEFSKRSWITRQWIWIKLNNKTGLVYLDWGNYDTLKLLKYLFTHYINFK